ncbi:hypothetical protein XENOCAPTIV_009382 [Xenoophorus captivus]|uniref:G-protein coupled receptors family 1 profile domain-containing protein n=1 Tax=Xenoophorus captivus TaxID=1517983 RepID=A0ABV0RGY2_9TELE
MSANTSSTELLKNCFFRQASSITACLSVIFIFMIPLFVFVLTVGYQRWRKQRFCSLFSTSSHIDVFTYNVVVLDLLCVLGTNLIFLGIITNNLDIWAVGSGVFVISSTGQMLFHLLTCIERYLAVVHPIFYLRLRGSAGIRIRNITIGCVWLIAFVAVVLTSWFSVQFLTISFLLLSFTSVAFCFCSLSMAINSSLHFQEYSCVFSETISILSSILVLHILMIPLFVFVLVVGFQRWRKQLFSSHFKRSTHINILTYNVVILDLLGVSGTDIIFFGPHTDNLGIWERHVRHFLYWTYAVSPPHLY